MRSTVLYLLAVLLTTANGGMAQDVKWAMFGLPYGHAGRFTNGIATIGSTYKKNKLKIINRQGEQIGEIDGELMFADKQNKIIRKETFSKYYLTDNQGKKISKAYDNIQPWNNCFICCKDFKYGILNRAGKLIVPCRYTLTTECGGQYMMLTGDGNPDIIDCNGKIVAEGDFLEKYALNDNIPIIEGEHAIYVKPSGKTMELDGRKLHYNNQCNYFVLTDKGGNNTYYNFDCMPIDIAPLATSSQGVTIVKQEDGKYAFRKTDGTQTGETYDGIDPMLWVEDRLAVRSGDKWGYVKADGSCAIRPQYNSASSFSYGMALVNNADIQGNAQVIDADGKTLLRFEGTLMSWYTDRIDGQPLFFSYVIFNSSNDLESIQNAWGFFNAATNKGIHNLASWPTFKNGYAVIVHSFKHGLCGIDGKIRIPMEYDLITLMDDGLVKVQDNLGIDQLFNVEGQMILDCKKAGINIKAPFSSGIAPATISNFGKNCEGYMYNIYTASLDEIVARYGTLGDSTGIGQVQNLVKQRLEYTDFYMNMGEKALATGKLEEAASHFAQIIRMNASYAPALYGLGAVAMQTEQYTEAAMCFERAITARPTYYDSYYMLALCYANNSEPQKALNICNKLLASVPDHKEARELRDQLNARKEEKRQRKINAVMAALYGLNTIANSLNNLSAPAAGGSVMPVNRQSATKSDRGGQRRECSSCHGTGYNSARERPAFYSYSEEDYEGSPCEICGSRSNHYHKPCPSCRGKGYVNY